MSNRRTTRPARNGAPASVRREADGTLKVVWPEGRPRYTTITAVALEGLIDSINAAEKAAAAAPQPRSLLARLGAWGR